MVEHLEEIDSAFRVALWRGYNDSDDTAKRSIAL